MEWIVVRHVPLDRDLSELTRFLSARGLVLRVTEENDAQILSVQDPQAVEPLGQLVDEFLRGEIQFPPENAADHQPNPNQEIHQDQHPPGIPLWMTPITLVLIIGSALGALLGSTEEGRVWALGFVFLGANQDFNDFLSLGETLASGEIWRLLTPAFLHFSFFHFLFNSFWLWDLGRRLELGLGKSRYGIFFVVTAVAANVTQYFWESSPWFGGMSGVVYALVGFLWIRQRLAPHPLFALPTSIIGFMLFWLVFCMTGIVDQFIAGSVANAAHVGGLIAGMVLGAFSGMLVRAQR